MVDCGLLFFVLVPVAFLAPQIHGNTPETGIGVWLSIILHMSVPAWAYFAGCDAYRGGRTVGKCWLGLRLDTLDGRRLGPGARAG